MARRRWRRKDADYSGDPISAIGALFLFGLIGYGFTHQAQLKAFAIIATAILVVGIFSFVLLRNVGSDIGSFFRNLFGQSSNFSDDQILYMLKGMTPAKFEQEMAKMFNALGYRAEVVGGANDGGIDVVAYKAGKKYFIQCKKFITREANPHDVRDFLGAITNFNNPAERGFFITTSRFTVMAEKTAEGNPRIELIDGLKLIQYYKMAYGKTMPVELPMPVVAENVETKKCPRCGGNLTLRTAHKGEHLGQQFWGCSNFPKCRYLENIQAAVAVKVT